MYLLFSNVYRAIQTRMILFCTLYTRPGHGDDDYLYEDDKRIFMASNKN